MGVSLTSEETVEFLRTAHTLILSTIRKSGAPLATPLWFLYENGCFYVSTLRKSAKMGHIRRDPRVCVLVEDGKHYLDLRAVVASCTAEVVEDRAEFDRIDAAIKTKYTDFAVDFSKAGQATQQHYQYQVILRLVPVPGASRSWHNRKLRFPKPS